MELRINEYQVTPEITFNFDELKNEVAERVSYYANLVYTDDQIKEAKADRARLRKIIDAIDSQRKQVKADLLAPYVELEKKLDEIKALINEPVQMIDKQIKEYEEEQKAKKQDDIWQMLEAKDFPVDPWLIFNPKWLNTTYSMKKIEEEIDAAITKYRADMAVLDGLTEFDFEAKEVYRKTLDLGQAMLCVNERKEEAKRKAEYEAKVSHETTDLPIEEPKSWVCFKAYVTVEQAMKLKEFFIVNGIEFKKGEGNEN